MLVKKRRRLYSGFTLQLFVSERDGGNGGEKGIPVFISAQDTHVITCSLAHSLSSSIAHIHSLFLSCKHTHTHTKAHSCSRSQRRSNSYPCSVAVFLRLTLSLSLSQPHTHTHTHTQNKLSRLTCGAHAILRAFKRVQSHSMAVKGV